MVTKSVVTAITKSKSASLHMTAGKRLKDITINTKPFSCQGRGILFQKDLVLTAVK